MSIFPEVEQGQTPPVFSFSSLLGQGGEMGHVFGARGLFQVGLVQDNHMDQPSKYPFHKHNFDLSRTFTPMQICQILKFEKQNNLAINVFGWEIGMWSSTTLLSEQPAYMSQANLLLLISEKEDKPHYVWVQQLKLLLYNVNQPVSTLICMCYLLEEDNPKCH